jgi:hypothetical protein
MGNPVTIWTPYVNASSGLDRPTEPPKVSSSNEGKIE